MQRCSSFLHLGDMKNSIMIIFSLLILLIVSPAAAQENPMADSVHVFLDKSLDIIETNSINRDTVDWAGLKVKVFEKAAAAQSYEEAAKVFPYIFEYIDDHHGALKLGKQSFSWNTKNIYKNSAVINAIAFHPKVEVKTLAPHIGYILLPGNSDFSGKNVNLDAAEIRKAIESLGNIRSWIVDLRLNTGGNMYQMLAGLAPILGEGKLGGFVNQHGHNDGEWVLRNGNIFVDSNQVSTLPQLVKSNRKARPLVVLISGRTASSGEVVAISAIGRKNTILIGENSAGYTTANEGFKINASAGLNLAVDYDADRNGKVYKDFVPPHILIEGGDNFSDIAQDLKIISAINWLKGKR